MKVKDLIGSELGLYDNNSDNHSSVLADHVIDVTAICSNSARCIIKYANVKRGRIAQINNWYEQDKDLGSSVHYHINEMTPHELALDSVFTSTSRSMRVDPLVLAKIIFANQ